MEKVLNNITYLCTVSVYKKATLEELEFMRVELNKVIKKRKELIRFNKWKKKPNTLNFFFILF